MTKNNDIAQKPTWVAIDIAKRRNDILIQPPARKRYRMTITNDKVDHDRFIAHLSNLGSPVSVGLKQQATIIVPLPGACCPPGSRYI